MMDASPDLLSDSSSPGPTMVNLPPPQNGASDNIAAALSEAASKPAPAAPSGSNAWRVMGGMAGSFVTSARGVVTTAAASVASKQQSEDTNSDSNTPSNAAATATQESTRTATSNKNNNNNNNNNKFNPSPPSSGNAFFANLTSNTLQPLQSMTKSISQSISHNITGKNTLPDKTTASQVLMFRQLLHTKCRPGLRLSRRYEGTVAQKAVLHMPWWERGIEQSKKMIISYDNLITRLWLSGAIMPFEEGGYAAAAMMNEQKISSTIDTLINEKGLPPVPHSYWVDRLGFQQDDPVTDFRSGGVLSLAMLVHIAESCPLVHSRFVPKPKAETITTSPDEIISLEEIITDDASVLPFGITCINITDMLAKFLLFSKAIDKMDALLSAKPFWKMFIDPNAMLVLQEVSLDLLCDVCVEIGRERRIQKLVGVGKEEEVSSGMPGSQDGKVTVFDFSEIMERTEKRVGDEVLGAGPQNVDELRAIARRVKSKYLMRIQLKEKHSSSANNPKLSSPLGKQIPPMPSKESMKNVTNSVMGGVGGFVSMLKYQPSSSSRGVDDGNINTNNKKDDMPVTPGGQEVEVHLDGTTSSPDDTLFGSPRSPVNPFMSSTSPTNGTVGEDDELEKLSAELGDLSAATAEAFDLLGDDFYPTDVDGDVEHTEELLDAMDEKVDPFAAFALDDDFLS